MSELTHPAPLRPGDAVRVVAPSGPFPPALVWRGLGWLRDRYRVRFNRGIFARDGYFAGDDARREEELRAALTEPDTRAIVCARGGYGASRYAHRLPWASLRRAPKWLVGFSDVTALHLEANRAGVASLHAGNVTALGRGDHQTREGLRRALEDPTGPRRWPVRVHVPGPCEGPLWGGNLALLHGCAVAGRLALPEGAVLLVEDVGERPYRLDRMVTTLLVGGHLDRVAGVALGEFTDCRPGDDGLGAEEVLVSLFSRLGVPVVGEVPVGHGRRNEPVVLGGGVRIADGLIHLGRVQ